MNQKDLLLLAIGVFLTMIAYVAISVHQINTNERINREIEPVTMPVINIDSTIFSTLNQKVE